MKNFSLKMFVLTFFMSAVLLAGFSQSVYASLPPVQPIPICVDQLVYADENCEQDASIDGGSYCECEPNGIVENDCIPPSLIQSPPGPYPLGTTDVTLTVDCDGQVASCDEEVVVIDDTPPEITCPGDIEVTDIWSCDDVVLDYEATATDNCEIGSDTCDPPSGSTFPEGVTPVICASTDTSGNQTQCQFLVEVDGPPSCGTSYPEEQSYWHRQCLALPAAEGGIDPGRNGRGPQELLESDFDDLMDCAEARLEDLGFFGVTTCEGMDADPPRDKCERALKQLTALILNVCSERVSSCCEVDVSAYGCSSTNVVDLTQEIADLIQSDECRIASSCAAAVNEGLAIIDTDG